MKDAVTGLPISGALVSVAGTNVMGVTGDDGVFALADIPLGLQTLRASALGYVSQSEEVFVFPGDNGRIIFFSLCPVDAFFCASPD